MCLELISMPLCCCMRQFSCSGFLPHLKSSPLQHPAPSMNECSSNDLPQHPSQNQAPSRRQCWEAAVSLPTPSAFKSTWKPLWLREESSFGRCRQTAKQLLSICSFARACISNRVFRTQAMLRALRAMDNLNKSCHLCGFLL